jgi:hypothetical protein
MGQLLDLGTIMLEEDEILDQQEFIDFRKWVNRQQRFRGLLRIAAVF